MSEWQDSVNKIIDSAIRESSSHIELGFFISGIGLALLNESNNGIRVLNEVSDKLYEIELTEQPFMNAFGFFRKILRPAECDKNLTNHNLKFNFIKIQKSVSDIVKYVRSDKIVKSELGLYLIGAGFAIITSVEAPENIDDLIIHAFYWTRTNLLYSSGHEINN